jgi:hypothetical protein
MGIDYNCYVGPYIQCKKEKGIRYKSVMTCSNKGCKEYGHHNSQKFCGNCGSVIGTIEFPAEVETVDSCEVQETIDEDLVPIHSEQWENHDIWILNKGWIRKLHYDPKYEEALVEVNDTAKEIFQFEKDFAKQIEIILKAYGTIEIKWGMILWMN